MELNKFYNIDCMEYMKTVPDNYFELAIVDPPYGIGADKMTMGSGAHLFKKDKSWDDAVPDKKYFHELFRIAKNQIIWGGNYYSDILPTSQHWIIWDKLNPNLSFAEGEMAWVKHGKNLRIFKKYFANLPDGKKIHPTQKPVALYRWLLQNYAKEGDKIFDSHVGSGSSIIACIDEGFDYVGCELDEDYYKAATERIEVHKSQGRLF
jgi:site-specific DNA-methyltransferase (adenine-specific)